MRSMHFLAVLPTSLLSMWLGACSGSVDGTSGDAAGAPASAKGAAVPSSIRSRETGPSPSPVSEFFVWTRESEERAVTHHLDESGREIEAIDGIVIAVSSGTWLWQEETRPVPTSSCELEEDDEGHELTEEPVLPGAATRASFRHLAGGAEQVVVDPGDEIWGNRDVQHDVTVVASMGPYLFIEESTYVDTCGAHGNTAVSSLIWNVATGKSIAVPMDLGSLQDERAAAIIELMDDEEDDALSTGERDVELTELVPQFSADGTLVLGLRFTAPTCYACTRGGWGSFSKSTIVGSRTVPRLLAPFVRPPGAVRAFLRSHPGATLGGWSSR